MTKNTNIRIGGNYIQQVFRWQSMVSKHPGPQINISEPFRYFGKEEMKKIKATLPTSFDWRLQNNQKGEPLLLTTREQLTCGSCYAFCAVQMLSHRISIATKGEKKPVLSPQDIISNGKRFIDENFIKPKNPSETTQLINEKKITRAINYFIDGCDGGLLISTVNYLVMKGVPLESIVPYANAELSSITASPNYYNRNDLERFYAMSSHSLVANLEAGLSADTIRLDPETLEFNNLNMMYAIVNHGPIITALNIFTDFFYYPNTGPVYEKQDYLVINGTTITSVFEGGHAVVLVGFGEWENEDGSKTPYWIGQNSWGPDWGYDGYFYFKRGENMCNFELDSCAVFVDLEKSPLPVSKNSLQQPNVNDNTTVIIGVVIGIILLVIIIVVAVVLIKKYKK